MKSKKKEMTSQPDPRSGDLTPLKNDEMSIYSYGTHDQVTRFTSVTKDIAAHVGTSYKQGKEMWILLMDKEETVHTEPTAPVDATNRPAMEKYKMLLGRWIDDEKDYKRDKGRVFRVIMTQSTTAMKNKIESLADYKKMEKDDDVKALLKRMKQLVYSTDKAQYEYWTMQATMRKLTNLRQTEKETLTDFYKKFINQLEATEAVWGKMMPTIMNDKTDTEQEEAREKYLACVFLAGVDRERYTNVIDDLNNDFLLGKVTYPSDASAMLTLLTNRRGSGGTSREEQALWDGVSEGTAFHQDQDDDDQNEFPDIKCYNCGQKGHHASDCKKKKRNKKKETNLAQAETDSEDDDDSQFSG